MSFTDPALAGMAKKAVLSFSGSALAGMTMVRQG
jgi:hypothetical protein